MIAAGYDPMAISRGIAKATDAIVDEVNRLATPISEKDKKELQQIATIAGNNDPSIGAVLADAFLKVGKDGVITIEEGKGNETTVEVVEGMQFDRGFLSRTSLRIRTKSPSRWKIRISCCSKKRFRPIRN